MTLALLGQGCLILAFLSALGQGFKLSSHWCHHFIVSQALSLLAALAVLIYAHLSDDFHLLTVTLHSHRAKPLLYKIAGVWGSHEGSMLLWMIILSLYHFSADCYLRTSSLLEPVRCFMACLSMGLLLFIIMTCDPFLPLEHPALEGQDLNPLLQDPSLIIHPPFLYAGYTGFAIPFALSLAALAQRSLPAGWLRVMRLWSLVPWCFLTAGITLGSFWAYYELGWGGWWSWDPVENVALLPWLSATALIHTISAAEKKQQLQTWVTSLALLTFSLCLMGTTVVRAGMLNSVHSFAFDPERGILLLILTLFVIGTALWFSLQALPYQLSLPPEGIISRSGILFLNTVLLLSIGLILALGTYYPAIMEGVGKPVTVSPAYFNGILIPLTLVLLFFLGVSSCLKWEKERLTALWPRCLPLFCITILTILLLFMIGERSLIVLLGIGLSVWTMTGTVLSWIKQGRIQTFSKLSWHFHGMTCAHLGFGIAIVGMVTSTAGQHQTVEFLYPGQTTVLRGYNLKLKTVTTVTGSNYRADQAQVEVYSAGISSDFNKENSLEISGKPLSILCPERRWYWTQNAFHAETALYSTLLSHIYAILGGRDAYGRCALQFYHIPLINLLWLGAILVTLGGLLAFIGRRQQKEKK